MSAVAGTARSRPGAGALLALLLVCIVVGRRFEEARATLRSVREAASPQAGPPEQVAPDWLPLAWSVEAVIGGLAAIFVIRVAVDIVMNSVRPNDASRRPNALKVVAYSSVGFWTLWQALGVLVVLGLEDAQAVRPIPVGLAAVLAIGAVVLGGAQVAGDWRNAWKRASVVRLQLIVLAALFAAVCVVPVTSAQSFDVLRAWGDGSLARAAAGLAGALLLGAVCRASAIRLLEPEPNAWRRHGWRRVGILRRRRSTGDTQAGSRRRTALPPVVLTVLAGLLALLELRFAAGVVVVLLLVVLATEWAEPVAGDGDRTAGAADDEDRIARAAEDEHRKRGLRRLAGTLGVVPLATVLIGLTAAVTDSSLSRVVDLPLLIYTLLAAAAFAVLVGHDLTTEADAPSAWQGRADWTLGLAGLACALVLGLAGGAPGLGASLILLVIAALLAFRQVGERGTAELSCGVGVALGAGLAVYLQPIAAPLRMGTFALVFFGIVGVLSLLHLAASLGARRAPLLFRTWLPQRVPVVTLVAAWAAAAWALSSSSTVHQTRTVDTVRAPGRIEDSVHAWLDRQSQERPGAQSFPMLLVAASGGGSKAAYWTDLVLDCVMGDGAPSGSDGECGPSATQRRRWSRLFLTSSVSGGSVGVRHLVTHRDALRDGRAWVREAAAREVLSPVAAWGLFHDLPAFMLDLPTDPRDCRDADSCRWHADRAVVQEAAVGGARQQITFGADRALLAAQNDLPVTVFNGAEDGANGRVLLSPLHLAPPRVPDLACPASPTGEPAAGSVDGHDVLHEQDLSLLTAALLSARFPVVAPAALLGDTEPAENQTGCTPPATLPPVRVRDGGYVENTGVLTITELLPALAAAIASWEPQAGSADGDRRPQVDVLVLSIDDDPVVSGGDPRIVTAPRRPLGISERTGHRYLTRLARDRLTSCQYPGVHYLRLSPPPQVGAQAATGWELSETTRERDLEEALDDRYVRTTIRRVQAILDGDPVPGGCR